MNKLFIIITLLLFIATMGLTMFFTGTLSKKPNTVEGIDAEQATAENSEHNNTNQSVDNIQSQSSSQTTLQVPQNAQTNEPKIETTLEEHKAQIAEAEKELTMIKAEIESLKAVKASIVRTQQLAKIYAGMQPDTAALILCELEEDLTVQILSQINDRTAGKIMNSIAAVNPSYGATISKLMAKVDKSETLVASEETKSKK